MQVSFNKGKNFYCIDDNAPINDILEILSKLNQKTWNSIVSKMDDKVIESFGICLYEWKELNLDAFIVETNDKAEQDRVNRFNILKKYLFYYQKLTGNNKFIL